MYFFSSEMLSGVYAGIIFCSFLQGLYGNNPENTHRDFLDEAEDGRHPIKSPDFLWFYFVSVPNQETPSCGALASFFFHGYFPKDPNKD